MSYNSNRCCELADIWHPGMCHLEPGYSESAQPCFQFYPVAMCGIAAKNFPVAHKAFSPQTSMIKETSVKVHDRTP